MTQSLQLLAAIAKSTSCNVKPKSLLAPFKISFRITDYRLRLYRKYPDRKVHQVVIYLSASRSHLVHETTFNLGELIHNFNVIRLWEQPTAIFQQYQGRLPFATLSQTNAPEETLRQVARQIENIADMIV